MKLGCLSFPPLEYIEAGGADDSKPVKSPKWVADPPLPKSPPSPPWCLPNLPLIPATPLSTTDPQQQIEFIGVETICILLDLMAYFLV